MNDRLDKKNTAVIRHTSADDCLEPNDEGWFTARCECGFKFYPLPGRVEVLDVLMEHAGLAASDEPTTQDYEGTFDEFWRDIVCNSDGSLNVEQVKKELHDYRFMIRNTSEAFDEVTGGQISKPNTLAFEVASVVEERIQERAEELAKDVADA